MSITDTKQALKDRAISGVGQSLWGDKWEKLDVITLIPLVGLNHRQPILHMSKIMAHFYYTDESINQFPIGYMINP